MLPSYVDNTFIRLKRHPAQHLATLSPFRSPAAFINRNGDVILLFARSLVFHFFRSVTWLQRDSSKRARLVDVWIGDWCENRCALGCNRCVESITAESSTSSPNDSKRWHVEDQAGSIYTINTTSVGNEMCRWVTVGVIDGLALHGKQTWIGNCK